MRATSGKSKKRFIVFFVILNAFSTTVILNECEESFYIIAMPNVRRANLRAHAPHISPVFDDTSSTQ